MSELPLLNIIEGNVKNNMLSPVPTESRSIPTLGNEQALIRRAYVGLNYSGGGRARSERSWPDERDTFFNRLKNSR